MKKIKIECNAEKGDYAEFAAFPTGAPNGPTLEVSVYERYADGEPERTCELKEFDALKLFKFLADEFGFRTKE